MSVPSFNRRPTRFADKPRRVRNGVRISINHWPERLSPAARRLWDSFVPTALPDVWATALGYAKTGQTRSIEFAPGEARAHVQEASAAPAEVVFRFKEFTPEQWRTIIDTMNQRAVFAASLLAGEIPPGLDELFEGLALRLEPRYPDDIEVLERGNPVDAWSAAVCCAAMLVADAMDKDPFLVFLVRGVAGDEVIERLRQKREADLDAIPIPGADAGRLASEPTAPPLDANLARFWEAGPELDLVETTPRPAEVKSALLRRLGPSPFKTARFPLVGLLATCYEIVSKAALDQLGQRSGETLNERDGESPSPAPPPSRE